MAVKNIWHITHSWDTKSNATCPTGRPTVARASPNGWPGKSARDC